MSDTIVISIRDGISPFLLEWLKNNPRFIRSATKSAGWYVQKGIKESVPEISLGWKPRIPFWVRKRLVPSAPKTWLGRMKREEKTCAVSAENMAGAHEAGNRLSIP